MQLSTAMGNALADAFDNHINTTGSANTGGHLVFQTSGGAANVVDIAGSSTFFGDAASMVISAAVTGMNAAAASAATLSQCELRDRDNSACAFLGCGSSGSPDFTLSSTSISSGETLTVNALTISVTAGSLDFS